MKARDILKLVKNLPGIRDGAYTRGNIKKGLRRVGVLPPRVPDKSPESRSTPGNMIWIFGSGRSGSTCRSRMMGEAKGYALWNEPQVGSLFGCFYNEQGRHLRDRKHFAFGGERKTWIPPMRRFILDLSATKLPGVARDPRKYMVVKEPNGSIGAPLIMEAIPEENKGPGKLRRKAKPRGWEEDLTPDQIESIENTTAPILERFYPGGST